MHILQVLQPPPGAPTKVCAAMGEELEEAAQAALDFLALFGCTLLGVRLSPEVGFHRIRRIQPKHAASYVWPWVISLRSHVSYMTQAKACNQVCVAMSWVMSLMSHVSYMSHVSHESCLLYMTHASHSLICMIWLSSESAVTETIRLMTLEMSSVCHM